MNVTHVIAAHNDGHTAHAKAWANCAETLAGMGLSPEMLLQKVQALQVAVPSWALGTGGTRFGRFAMGGEPRNLEEKIADISLLAQLSGTTKSVSLHIPWDIPTDANATKAQLAEAGLWVDSVNSNTFQDQPGQEHSYKFGSLCHTHAYVRNQAVAHNLEVINYGVQLGARVHTVWLADGSNFPGQHHFRKAYERTLQSLQAIYAGLPEDWTLLLEYKPYEPNFYSMIIPDWGSSHALCRQMGPKAKVLVDLGHHLPNTNIEQIVARLLHFEALGGFHFNGSMYGDDDLSTGSIKPYQLFLIFNELTAAAQEEIAGANMVSYMIDASHNTKDPLEDLLQALEQIAMAYAKSLLVNRDALQQAQENNEVALAESILQDAFAFDVRPLLAESRRRNGHAIHPLKCFAQAGLRNKLIAQRGKNSLATGL